MTDYISFQTLIRDVKRHNICHYLLCIVINSLALAPTTNINNNALFKHKNVYNFIVEKIIKLIMISTLMSFVLTYKFNLQVI